jgi:hypothetical protein
MKSSRMKMAEHFERGGDKKCVHNFGWRLEEKKHPEELGVNNRIILKKTFLEN